MEGYYLDSKVPLKKGLNFFVISDRSKFIKYFGRINKADTPRFDFEHVLVMALPPSNKEAKLSFLPEAAKAGNFIEIYCNATSDKHEVPYTTHPIIVAAIPKYFSVTKVNFYNEESKKLLASLLLR